MLILSSVLHQGLKLENFHQHGWEEEWIENAEALVCNKYTTCYEGKVGPAAAALDTTHTAATATADNDNDFAAFSNILVTNYVGSWTSKLQEFLQKPVKNVKDRKSVV